MTAEFGEILERVDRYYTAKVQEHGATPGGVDWSSVESQVTRFDQLLRAAPDDRAFSLNDYGCGYGALAAHLDQRGLEVDYRGYDLSEEMVERARGLHDGRSDRRFTSDAAELEPADVTVASGIFNVKLETADSDWDRYVEATVDRLAQISTKAFAFNMLTSYSDAELMRDDLHYADPCRWFDRCKRSYSRHVALLHDYGLWEFTMIVRLT